MKGFLSLSLSFPLSLPLSFPKSSRVGVGKMLTSSTGTLPKLSLCFGIYHLPEDPEHFVTWSWGSYQHCPFLQSHLHFICTKCFIVYKALFTFIISCDSQSRWQRFERWHIRPGHHPKRDWLAAHRPHEVTFTLDKSSKANIWPWDLVIK